MKIVCTDLEGVLVPEIWINVALKNRNRRTQADHTGHLRLRRIDAQNGWDILDRNQLKLKDITDVIATMAPMAGALDFLDWLRARTQVIIVSDTFR